MFTQPGKEIFTQLVDYYSTQIPTKRNFYTGKKLDCILLILQQVFQRILDFTNGHNFY